MTTPTTTRQDELVHKATAFLCWNVMLKAMQMGYVPTLGHSKSESKLARLVEQAGFKTFRVSRTSGV